MFIEFHRNLIADRLRNEAFHNALRRVIVPGETTVADLGSGSGLLGFLALKLGARDVYFYEYSPALKLSQKIARANQLKRCHFIHELSRRVAKPVPVDVVVSETLGNYAYEENIIENLSDAQRFLKPQGVVIPQRVAQYVAPVVEGRYRDELCVWDRLGYGLDFESARTMSLNNLYVRKFGPVDLLDAGSTAARWDSVDLTRRKNSSLRRGQGQWVVRTDTTIHGFALWWDCVLIDDIILSTGPGAAPTHWEQIYCPVLEPVQVRAGQRITIELHSDSRYELGATLRWDVTVHDGDRELSRQELDMKRGGME
jgi:protein arginine N-methyltransferase 1